MISQYLISTLLHVDVAAGRFDLWMVGGVGMFDVDHQLVRGTGGPRYDRKQLEALLGPGFTQAMFTFCRLGQGLKLSRQEVALLQTITLTFTGTPLLSVLTQNGTVN